MKFLRWISPGTFVVTIGLVWALVLGTDAVFPDPPRALGPAYKPFRTMPKVAKSRVTDRPRRTYSSGSSRYSSRGSGSYSSRRSYRGGGYRYGK